MFLGHFAVGFAAKRAAPRTPLTVLVMAALSLDMVSPVFRRLGIERVRYEVRDSSLAALDVDQYRWSHSLLFVLLWAPLLAWLYLKIRHDRRGALWVGLVTASHWLLDFVSHNPDLPIAPGIRTKVGIELWSSWPAAITMEVGTLAVGVALYVSATRAKNWLGHLSLWSLAVALVTAYIMNITGAHTPNVESVRVMAVIAWGVLAWFVLVDATRVVRSGRRPASVPMTEAAPR